MKGQKFKNLQIFANKKNQTGKGIRYFCHNTIF